ncbi:MAG TPA: hypothetical protein HPP83_05675, partial [Candidatus Hydrogenedentes bacterium]|nr:hypothetical protein [Candidatus Hydrogenedentota bacterium]
FASSHGTARPSYILKSKRPYQIDAFELVHETNFSYPQPWHIPGKGFLFLHTRYEGGRCLCWQRSADGVTWSERSRLASVDEGHYQVSWPCNGKVGTAFNYHPKAFAGDAKRHGLNWRTNLYYVETPDMGASWRTVSGAPVALPLTTPHNPALVIDYESQGLLAYMKDLNYDPNGNPIILHVTARSWEPGPAHGPRAWRIARWTGAEWRLHAITTSDSNYDMGSLYVEAKGVWRVIAPTETGPQPYNPGGEIAVWVSDDRGQSWSKIRQLTRESPFNHTYVRRPLNAQPGFYALWADGHARRPSESRLYFADKQGARVRRLPYEMDEAYAVPDTID